MIDYQVTEIFTWLVEQLTEARCTGDVNKSKALLAELFKLLGNSSYEKTHRGAGGPNMHDLCKG